MERDNHDLQDYYSRYRASFYRKDKPMETLESAEVASSMQKRSRKFAKELKRGPARLEKFQRKKRERDSQQLALDYHCSSAVRVQSSSFQKENFSKKHQMKNRDSKSKKMSTEALTDENFYRFSKIPVVSLTRLKIPTPKSTSENLPLNVNSQNLSTKEKNENLLPRIKTEIFSPIKVKTEAFSPKIKTEKMSPKIKTELFSPTIKSEDSSTEYESEASSPKDKNRDLSPIRKPEDETVEPEIQKNEKRKKCSIAYRYEYLRSLQQERHIGIWIKCCKKKCGKWRYVEDYNDSMDVPNSWSCNMNSEAKVADCSIPEQDGPPAKTERRIVNAYNVGTIVWARMAGYPWWPAIIDDCPQHLRYYETRESSNVPFKYHVTFFDEKRVQRAWILVKNLKPYVLNSKATLLKKTVYDGKNYNVEVRMACKLADQALPLTIHQRLQRFSSVSRIFGGILNNDSASGVTS